MARACVSVWTDEEFFGCVVSMGNALVMAGPSFIHETIRNCLVSLID